MPRKKITKKTTALVKKKRSVARSKKRVAAKKTAAKTATPKKKAKRSRKPVDLEIVDESAEGASFVKKAGASMYAPVLEKVKKLKPGRMVKVKIPKDHDPVKFRQKISSAVRKRLTEEERPDNLRTRLIHVSGKVTHVAVVCSAA